MSARLPAKDTCIIATAVGSIRKSDIEGREQIGDGAEAVVYKGFVGKYGLLAVKEFRNVPTKQGINEIELLIKHSKHPNIVQIYGLLMAGSNQTSVGYIMELMALGNLGQFIHTKSEKYSCKEIFLWTEQIARGLGYLHDEGIIHRDIKPKNLLMDTRYRIKISDFGLARPLDTSLTSAVGTLFYMAPEVYQLQKYNCSADIYSLTITLWEILHRKKPYYQLEANDNRIIPNILSGERPPIDNRLDDSIVDLLLRGWHTSHELRPSVKEFLEFARTARGTSLGSTLKSIPGTPSTFRKTSRQLTGMTEVTYEAGYDTIESRPLTTKDLAKTYHENGAEKKAEAFAQMERLEKRKRNSTYELPNSSQRESAWSTVLRKLGIRRSTRSSMVRRRALILGGGESDLPASNKIYLMESDYESWKLLSLRMPYYAKKLGAAFLDGEIYVFGGESLVHHSKAFKLDRNMKWKRLAEMNEPRWGITNSTVVLDGCIWVLGGGKHSNTVERYDPRSNSWTFMQNMNEYRVDAGAAVIGDKIFVCGGKSINRPTSAAEFYDPQSDIWTHIAPMPAPRRSLAVVADGPHLIALGGGDGYVTSFSTVWRLDIRDFSPSWTEVAPMKKARSNFVARKFGEVILAAGGYQNSQQYPEETGSRSVEIFDRVRWNRGKQLPAKLAGMAMIFVSQNEAKQLKSFTARL